MEVKLISQSGHSASILWCESVGSQEVGWDWEAGGVGSSGCRLRLAYARHFGGPHEGAGVDFGQTSNLRLCFWHLVFES